MSEYLNQRRQNFTIIANQALLNPALSLKAKGLLCVMLSRPDNWTYRMDWLCKQSKEGREATQGAIKELTDHGYVLRQAKRDAGTGKLQGWVYTVSDSPLTDEPSSGLTVERETRQTVFQADSSNKELNNTDSKKTDLKEEDGAEKLETESFGADAPPSPQTFPENLNLEPQTAPSADALNGLRTSSSSQEPPLQKIDVSQKPPPDEKNLPGGAGGPVHKSGDKSKKVIQQEIFAEIRALAAPPSVSKFWEEWREYILERNPKVTLRAASKQLECLGRWLDEGKNLRHIVDYSIQGSYQGLFGDDAKFDPARPGGSSSSARASPGQSLDPSRYDLSQPAPQTSLASSDEEIPF